MNAPRTDREMLAEELRGISASLQEALNSIIEAGTASNGVFKTDAFCEALRLVNDARLCLKSEAEKLAEVQP